MPRTKAAPKQSKEEKSYEGLMINGHPADEYVEALDSRISESKSFWDKEYKLEKAAKANEKLYLGEQATSRAEDEDTDEIALDNRIFSAIRTIVPYVTRRITEPEVHPSSNSPESKKFAQDFEKAIYIHADEEELKEKTKYALEDAIIRRRGYLKPRYDAATKNFCKIEYVPAESIVIDHKSRPYEEPRYFRHYLDKTVEDLLLMFPENEAAIKRVFKIEDNTPYAKYLESHVINEDWSFVSTAQGLDLIVCWQFNKQTLGCIQDPNWLYDEDNFLPHHMMPLVFFNVLNDGRRHIDKTSFVEQAKFSQATIDRRSEQIGENAGLGSVGMPVVDSEAMAEDQVDFLTFEPDTAIELSVPEGKRIDDVFTTWKAGSLPADVYKDKEDAIGAVENAFGASAVMQGNQSDNNTLGQDELLRDNSMGRQMDIVDAIDMAHRRLYKLIAQFLLVYGQEEELFESTGENSEFDFVTMHTAQLDTKCKIRIKGGTCMPIDNPQRRATADKAASQAMIDPLTYWEIMDAPNAQKYAKRITDYTADPAGFLSDINEEVFDRFAYTDLQYLKLGKQPPYRDELDKSYFDYLNKYVLSGDLENPKIPEEVRQAISQFIDLQLVRGQKMLGMAETQLPTAQDVQTHNAEVDAANSANTEATKGIPPPMKPTPQGSPKDQGAKTTSSQPTA